MSSFAPGYPRDEQGRIVFPKDYRWRKELIVKEATHHPAKNSLYIYQELVNYLTQPGDTVMDIMAGSGSVLLAAKMGRRVVAIELALDFYGWLLQSRDKMGLTDEQAIILQGDCRKLLPLQASCIIFSPPYGNVIKEASARGSGEERGVWQIASYMESDLARLNDFLYKENMAKVYKLCKVSLLPGGYCCAIIRDRIVKGQKVEFSYRAAQAMSAAGLEPHEWHKRKINPSSRAAYNRQQGYLQVDEEHILIFRKPGG